MIPKLNTLQKQKIWNTIQIIGFAGLVSWTTIFFTMWVTYNLYGLTFFTTGEPIIWIKYMEWGFAILGIIVGYRHLIRLIIMTSKKKFDPWV